MAFPLVLAIFFAVFTAVGVTGTSTGILSQYLTSGSDQDLLLGHPQPVRSDEWFVQTSWTISQVEQGLPSRNATFPGGMDSTVQHDMPSWDPWNIFRPHLWGFWFLPLDQAMAWKWWLPGFMMMAACYAFVVTMIPKRPVFASILALGFYFSPFFQWWYLSVTYYPITWAFTLMTASLWLARTRNVAPRILFPLAVGYLTITTGMGIYAPFIIPSAYVAGFFVLGVILASRRFFKSWKDGFRCWRVLLYSGVCSGLVLVLWLVTRLEAISGLLNTVYPGHRTQSTGGATAPELLALFSAAFTTSLDTTWSTFLGGNPSESSTFFLAGIFLIVPLGWHLVDRWRKQKRVDWIVVSIMCVFFLFASFLLVPNWDWLANLIFLDRVPFVRLRIGLGFVSFVAMVLLIRCFDGTKRKPPWSVTIVSMSLALLVNIALLSALYFSGSPVISAAYHWKWIFAGFFFSLFFFNRISPTLAATSLLLISLLGSSGVNPLYRGVFDTRNTEIGESVRVLNEKDPGSWVGVGNYVLVTSILVQSGAQSYNGFQTSPPVLMWSRIDPDEAKKNSWNRLANVSWEAGRGNPDPQNPEQDQIKMIFDSCAQFAQINVKYVLASEPVHQGCLNSLKIVSSGSSTFYIYSVSLIHKMMHISVRG